VIGKKSQTLSENIEIEGGLNTARTDAALGNKRIDTLHAEFERLGVRGYWQPRPEQAKPVARLWSWADIHPILMEAAEVVDLGTDAARRFVGLQTRSQTLSYGFQIVMPGESAEAHHHSPSALRFVVKGQGGYTTSNGEPMNMAPGDLLTQPNWVWHDHNNETDDPMIWVDSLDAGVVRMLDARFHEPWRDGRVQPLVKPHGYSPRRYGVVRPPGDEDWAVPFHYEWTETLATLDLMAQDGEADPYDGVLLEYLNPVTGGHTFRNTACFIQMLRPGERTERHRHTGTWITHVYQGTGATIVGEDKGTTLQWQDKDVFVVPSWEPHCHENRSDQPAYLFSVCDRPIVEAAGLYREEPCPA
jgi:gentisate 1,2-dioxygenase